MPCSPPCRCRPACRSAVWRSTGRRTPGSWASGSSTRRPGRTLGRQNQYVRPRHTREEIGAVWTQQRRMETWLQVELTATDAWVAEGVVPEEAARACRERASFTVEAVEERERTTGHDVAAFVDVVADSSGEEGRWIHYGIALLCALDAGLL